MRYLLQFIQIGAVNYDKYKLDRKILSYFSGIISMFFSMKLYLNYFLHMTVRNMHVLQK